MSSDEPARSLEERVTRLEMHYEHRGTVLAALVVGVLVAVYLLQAAGILKLDIGAARG